MEELDYSRILELESEEDDEQSSLITLYCLLKKRQKSVVKSDFLKQRKTKGDFSLFEELTDTEFKNYYRLYRHEFDEIHTLIENDSKGAECNVQNSIGTREKLAIFLRFFATGDSYKSLSYCYRVADRTVSKIVSQLSEILWKRLQPIYLPEPNQETWKNVAEGFKSRWQFYNCLGSIDGKHITIKKPPKSGSGFFNYKQYFSIVLMASCDAYYKFTAVDIGSMGKFSDGHVFNNSVLGEKLRDGHLSLPPPVPLPGNNFVTPFVFIADEAFPLMINLMRPFPKRLISNNYEHQVFNCRLSHARQTIECTFGILAARFRMFKKPFECKLETVDSIVKAACVLHNFIISKRLSVNLQCEDEIEPTLGNNNQLISISANNSRSTDRAFEIRNDLTRCFNSAAGSVSWQHRGVQEGRF